MKKNFITSLAILFGTAMTINLSACGGDSSTSADEKNPQNQENTETEDNSSDNKSNTSSNSSKTNSSSNTTTSSSSSQKTSVNLDPVKSGALVDERDGQSYRTVQIGTQIWMAENMKLDVSDGFCYGDVKDNCEKYGTFYTAKTALRICPEGWRLPTSTDWNILARNIGTEKSDKYGGGTFVYNNDDAISKIRSKDGWENSKGSNALDFSAYPTGYFNGTQYSGLGQKAYFMGKRTANEDDSWAYISEKEIYVTGGKVTSAAMPVRCMQEIPYDATNEGVVKGVTICKNGKWEMGSDIDIILGFKECNRGNIGEVLKGYICDSSCNWHEATKMENALGYKTCSAENVNEVIDDYVCDYNGILLTYDWREATEIEKAVNFAPCNQDNVKEILNGYICDNPYATSPTYYMWRKVSDAELAVDFASCGTDNEGTITNGYICSGSAWHSLNDVVIDSRDNQTYLIKYYDSIAVLDMSGTSWCKGTQYNGIFNNAVDGCTWDDAMKACPEGWHVPKSKCNKNSETAQCTKWMTISNQCYDCLDELGTLSISRWTSSEADADSVWVFASLWRDAKDTASHSGSMIDAKSELHPTICIRD